MKKYLSNKITLFLILLVTLLFLLPQFSLAQSENIQMIKKSSNEYLIYVDGLLNENFEFAFANDSKTEKGNLTFEKCALDKAENGNNIAFIDSELYSNYFNEKDETFLWVKVGEEYKLEAEKINLNNALSEEEIEDINRITKRINVKFGQLNLPAETIDGVKVTRKMGTINLEELEGTVYTYKMTKVEVNSQEENFVRQLIPEINQIENKDMFTKLSIYNEFLNSYKQLQPTEWNEVEENVIKQPTTSKKGEQYLVWINAEDVTGKKVVDVQIMTCNDEYTPVYEKQEIVHKVTTKLPVTGENLILFIVAAIILVLILVVIFLKVKNNKKDKV